MGKNSPFKVIGKKSSTIFLDRESFRYFSNFLATIVEMAARKREKERKRERERWFESKGSKDDSQSVGLH